MTGTCFLFFFSFLFSATLATRPVGSDVQYDGLFSGNPGFSCNREIAFEAILEMKSW